MDRHNIMALNPCFVFIAKSMQEGEGGAAAASTR